MENSGTQSTVERIAVEEVPPRPRPQLVKPETGPPPQPSLDLDALKAALREAVAAIPRPVIHPTTHPETIAMLRAIAAVIAASAAVLATRVLLGAVLLGAFVLAVMAVRGGSWLALAVLIAFAVLIVGPMVILEVKTKWRVGE